MLRVVQIHMALVTWTATDVRYGVRRARDSGCKDGGEARIRLKVDKHAGEP